MDDNRAHYRKLRDQALEQRGVKIENQNPKHPIVENLQGLFERNADAHGVARGNAGLPNNNEGLGFDPRNRDNYDHMDKNPGSFKVVERFSPKLGPGRDDD
jgi:hypothetical protein